MDIVDISVELMVVAGVVFWLTVIGAAWFEIRVVRKLDEDGLLGDVRDDYPEKAAELLKRTAVKARELQKGESKNEQK